MNLIFEWDENKAASNLRNHKVSFDEAKTIFNDLFLVTFADDFHSDSEERFISLGNSASNRVLLVVHTEFSETEFETIIRIISCRKAMATEREIYEQG